MEEFTLNTHACVHQCVKDVFEVHCVRHWYKSQQSSHGLSHFLFVALASETPYHGSNEEDHLRAGSAGPLLSGGPLAHARVSTLSSPWSLLQLDGVVCCWMPGEHFPDLFCFAHEDCAENISSGKGPHQLPRWKSEENRHSSGTSHTHNHGCTGQPAGPFPLSKLVLWACRY